MPRVSKAKVESKPPVAAPVLSPGEQAKELIVSFVSAAQLDELHLSLISLTDMIDAGEISLFLNQADKTDEQKRKFIQALIKELPSHDLSWFFSKLLTSSGPESFLEPALRPFLAALKAEADHCAVVKLTVAETFLQEDLKEMCLYLSEKLQRHVVLSLTVDKRLIGGAIIQYGNYISDYSLKTQLNLFREHWKKATVVE